MMDAKTKFSMLSSIVLAGSLMTGCVEKTTQLPNPDLDTKDQNVVHHAQDSGYAMPIPIMDLEAEGLKPLRQDVPAHEKTITKSSSGVETHGKKNVTVATEEQTHISTEKHRTFMVLGYRVESTDGTKSTRYQSLAQVTPYDEMMYAPLGQSHDEGSPDMNRSQRFLNYTAAFGHAAEGFRNGFGIYADNLNARANMKSANAYEVWANKWTADVTNNVLTGGSTTIGDIISSSNSDAYADAYSNAYSNSSLEFNPNINNSLEFNPNINNSLEFNPEIINSSEINQELINSQEGGSSTPQQGSGCKVPGKRTSSLYTPGPSRTVYAVSAKGIDTSGEGRYPRNGRLVFALS